MNQNEFEISLDIMAGALDRLLKEKEALQLEYALKEKEIDVRIANIKEEMTNLVHRYVAEK